MLNIIFWNKVIISMSVLALVTKIRVLLTSNASKSFALVSRFLTSTLAFTFHRKQQQHREQYQQYQQ